MTEPTNHWKLGLFVVAGLVLGVGALAVIGTASLQEEGVFYRSYFDEAVTGLETGAAVKFRGVTIGRVRSIEIGRDREHVVVGYALETQTTQRLGWVHDERDQLRFSVPEGLRAQLQTMGVSGVKYLQLDHFDPERFPKPVLEFEVPSNTIPTAPSTFKSIEDSLVRFVDRTPVIAERSVVVLEQLHAVLAQLQSQELPARAASTLAHLDEALVLLNGKLRALPVEKLSTEVVTTAVELNETLRHLQLLLARMDGDRGLLASVQRASDSMGDMAGGARGMGEDLGITLRDFRELIETLQSFVDTLERDSDMLLKGRSELKGP